MSSLDRILPFLKPIEDLLVDPAITEVMVNDGGRQVFVERRGCIEYVPDRTLEVRNLTVAIKNIARACGDEISERQPMLDARLEDGSRVAAMFPPCAVDNNGVARLKLRPQFKLNTDQRIVKIKFPPVYDHPPTLDELFQDAARNHELERACRAADDRAGRQAGDARRMAESGGAGVPRRSESAGRGLSASVEASLPGHDRSRSSAFRRQA